MRSPSGEFMWIAPVIEEGTMSQRSEHLRKASALSLMLLWLITSCVNQNLQNPGGSQPDAPPSATATLPEHTFIPNAGTPYPFGGNPYPMGYVTVTSSPTYATVPPTFTQVPYLPPPTPAASLSQSHCYEETLNFYNHGATVTPTSPGWNWDYPTLTYAEVGNAAPEEIAKLLLAKYFDQFKTPRATHWELENYVINRISITTKIDCGGPNELENYWGHVEYSVKPPADARDIFWLAGGAQQFPDGWIANGLDFVLIKTKSDYELILTGNG
jgi:hypothetical protein